LPVIAEPEYNSGIGQIALSAEQIARDHVIFYDVIRSYACFSKSAVVGPDVVAVQPHSEGTNIIQA